MMMQISTNYESPLMESYSTSEADGDDQFLTLLLAQLGSQNPLEPLEDADFMNQLSQFSQMEQFQALNENLVGITRMQLELTGLSQLSQGGALVGKYAEFVDANGEKHSGLIDRMRIDSGSLVFEMGGEDYSFSQLTAVLADPTGGKSNGTSDGSSDATTSDSQEG
jgi:flagellar basal-body rod modification protein FlgD